MKVSELIFSVISYLIAIAVTAIFPTNNIAALVIAYVILCLCFFLILAYNGIAELREKQKKQIISVFSDL